MELFTYLMAKNDHNTSVKKDLFSNFAKFLEKGVFPWCQRLEFDAVLLWKQ